MDIIVRGRIEEVLPVVSGTSANGNVWHRQEYVILHEEGQYEKRMVFSIFGKDKIDGMHIATGEYLTVHLNVDARMHNNSWFNSVLAWKVDREGQQVTQPAYQAPVHPSAEPMAQDQSQNGAGDDDLPF